MSILEVSDGRNRKNAMVHGIGRTDGPGADDGFGKQSNSFQR